jgi:hypothetical protein
MGKKWATPKFFPLTPLAVIARGVSFLTQV